MAQTGKSLAQTGKFIFGDKLESVLFKCCFLRDICGVEKFNFFNLTS